MRDKGLSHDGKGMSYYRFNEFLQNAKEVAGELLGRRLDISLLQLLLIIIAFWIVSQWWLKLTVISGVIFFYWFLGKGPSYFRR